MVIATGERCSSPQSSSRFNRYSHLLNSSPAPNQQGSKSNSIDILWALDHQGVFTLFEPNQDLNPAQPAEGFIGRTAFDVFKKYPSALDAVSRGLSGNRIGLTIDMGGLNWDIQGYPLFFENGEVSGLVGVANHISPPQENDTIQQSILGVLTALRDAGTYAQMPSIILQQSSCLFDPLGVLLALSPDPEREMRVEAASGIWESFAGKSGHFGPRSFHPDGDLILTSAQDPPAEMLNAHHHTITGVQLVAQDRLIGTLWMAVRQSLMVEQVQLLAAFGDIVANALNRSHQNELTQHRLQRLAALHDIDRAITNNTEFKVTLEIILNHILTQLEIDAAAIFLLNSTTNRLEYSVGSGFFTDQIKTAITLIDDCRAGRYSLTPEHHGNRKYFVCEGSCLHLSLREREGFCTHFGTPLVIRGQIKGLLELFHRQPMNPDDEWVSFLETLATQTAIAVDNAELFNGLQFSNTELTMAYETTLEGWVRALDLRDEETEWHTQRVTEMTLRLAQAVGIASRDLIHIRRGALLHDIGKMGITDRILNKPGPLSEQEWDIMKRHPTYARKLLAPISYLRHSVDIPYHHHEKWDGSGYPDGLQGESIPLAARIFAVVDVWDALRSDRPYRQAWSTEKAKNYILHQSGQHFDPWVVEKFFELGLDRWDGRPDRVPHSVFDPFS